MKKSGTGQSNNYILKFNYDTKNAGYGSISQIEIKLAFIFTELASFFFPFKIGNSDLHAKYFGLEKAKFINLYTRKQQKNPVHNIMLWQGHLLHFKQTKHYKIFKVLANEL